MALGTERGTLGDLRIVTRTWGYGDAAEYQADLLAPTSAASNFAPIVHLSHQDADEIEAFADVLRVVAREVRHQYCDEDCSCPSSGEDEQEVTTEEFGEAVDQLDAAQAELETLRAAVLAFAAEMDRDAAELLGPGRTAMVVPAARDAGGGVVTSTCRENGCASIHARGMCRKHYDAWKCVTPVGLRPKVRGFSPEERFKTKYVQGAPDECWQWTAPTGGGYGSFYVSPARGMVQAHTYAVELATGQPCPPGMEGCHRCDNPPCVNPAHVYYGTRQQNVDDKVRRGRQPRGESSCAARLTETQVLEIRGRYARGSTPTHLAEEFEVSQPLISMIVSGKRWAHVGGPIGIRMRRGRRVAPSSGLGNAS